MVQVCAQCCPAFLSVLTGQLYSKPALASSALPAECGAMSVSEPLTGRATVASTRARLERANALPGWSRVLGKTGLHVSALGFGTYRVEDSCEAHLDALRDALVEGGVNLIDTSWNYSVGGAERALGRVLRELVSLGKLEREEVVVVSKVGYLQGELLRDLKLEEEVEPLEGRFARVSSDHWHSIAP